MCLVQPGSAATPTPAIATTDVRGGFRSACSSEPMVARAEQPTGEAAAYESQTAGIVDMFKKLDDKFEEERESGQKNEMSKKLKVLYV